MAAALSDRVSYPSACSHMISLRGPFSYSDPPHGTRGGGPIRSSRGPWRPNGVTDTAMDTGRAYQRPVSFVGTTFVPEVSAAVHRRLACWLDTVGASAAIRYYRSSRTAVPGCTHSHVRIGAHNSAPGRFAAPGCPLTYPHPYACPQEGTALQPGRNCEHVPSIACTYICVSFSSR
jgi:hypothetical protein